MASCEEEFDGLDQDACDGDEAHQQQPRLRREGDEKRGEKRKALQQQLQLPLQSRAQQERESSSSSLLDRDLLDRGRRARSIDNDNENENPTSRSGRMVVDSNNNSTNSYRKDREEWSDSAIEGLLDAYTQRFELLNRGNLRGRDWEDVAAAVSLRCDGDKGKSVEQCKNKIDNLKKRFKVECHRLTTLSGSGSGSGSAAAASHWPWFAKLHLIVSTSNHSNSSSPNRTNDNSISGRQPPQEPRIHAAIASPSNTNTNTNTNANANTNTISNAPARHSSKRFHATPLRVAEPPKCKWRRVLFKISGAAIAGPAPHNVDSKVIMLLAREIQVATRQGVQVAAVIGSRNIFCGDSWIAATGVDRAATFQICMMASVMNAMLLQASLEKIGVATRVQTALTTQDVTEPYIRRKAISHLDKGRVVIFGGIASALSNPLFTTDAAAALRASEIDADAVLKGITGDALYGCHPGNSNSSSFDHISYREFVSRGFTPMDTTAIAFCEENNIPVVLFNLLEPGNISRALAGDQVGTLIDQTGRIG